MIKKYLGIVGLFLSLLFVLSACTQTSNQPAETVGEDNNEVNVENTETSNLDFQVTAVSGREISLSSNVEQEKPTVVYFMASWCPSCAKNWESLNEVYPKYKDDVDFVAISIDPTDTPEVLTDLASDKAFVFDAAPGNNEVLQNFDVTKQTAKFAIDSDGNIVERHDGILSTEEWDAFFAQLV